MEAKGKNRYQEVSADGIIIEMPVPVSRAKEFQSKEICLSKDDLTLTTRVA